MLTEKLDTEEFAGYTVPPKLKHMVIDILRRFAIGGVCDGMYIANVVAYYTGCGNGDGYFSGEPEIQDPVGIAERLRCAYWSCIPIEDRKELEDILRSGHLEPRKALAGLDGIVASCQAEMSHLGEESAWRRHYLSERIQRAKDAALEIRGDL